eukprot:UN16858
MVFTHLQNKIMIHVYRLQLSIVKSTDSATAASNATAFYD